MRRLWKHEWKYHLFFVIMLLVVLLVDFHYHLRGWMYYYYVDSVDLEDIQLIWETIWTFGGMNYQFLERVVIDVLIVLLVKKGIIYYIEKNACGREFFQSIPVSKNERFCFHLLMDVLTVVMSVIAIGIYEPIVLQNMLLQKGVEIPWLFHSYIGMAVTNISYIMMLLGVLYVVENMFVNGPMKLVGFGGIIFVVYYVNEFIFSKHPFNIVVQAIYGFISRASVGGNYYGKISDSAYYGIVNEPGEELYHIWIHDHLNPPFLFQGEQLDYSLLAKDEGALLETMTSMNLMYDFSNASSYIWHVIGYLMIAIVLIVVAKYLANRCEVSKEGFYFDFAIYVVSGFLAIAFYVTLLINRVSGWHQVACVASALLLFVALVCLFDVHKAKSIQQRIKAVGSTRQR